MDEFHLSAFDLAKLAAATLIQDAKNAVGAQGDGVNEVVGNWTDTAWAWWSALEQGRRIDLLLVSYASYSLIFMYRNLKKHNAPHAHDD